MKRGASNRQISPHSFFGNPAQNVNPEFKTERVNVIGQRLEAGAVFCRWNSVDGGSVTAIGIETELRCGGVVSGGVIGHVPAGIHDNIFPAVGFQMLCHPGRIRFDVGFADGFTVGVPTVPAHGRRGGQQSLCFGIRGIANDQCGENPGTKKCARNREKNYRAALDRFPVHPADLSVVRRRFYVTH